METSKSLTTKLLISSLWLWLAIFCLVPVGLIFITSFLSYDPEQLYRWHFTLANYAQLTHIIYLKIFWQSFVMALTCTLICLLVGYPVAYIISHSRPRIKLYLLILTIIPFWTSSLIRSYALMTLLKAHGLINKLLLMLGIIHQPLQLLYTNMAVIIAIVYSLLPFMIMPLYSNIEKLDHQLIAAARDLGANKRQIFFRIILPLTLPGIMGGTLLVFLPAMTLFYIPVLLGGAKSILLGNLIEYQFLFMHNWPLGTATSALLTIAMMLLILIYRRISQRRLGSELI